MKKWLFPLVSGGFLSPAFVTAQYLSSLAYQNPVATDLFAESPTSVFSAGFRPAQWTQFSLLTMGMYGERLFMMSELGFHQLAVAIPTRKGNIGLSILQQGFSSFRESKAGFGYAKKLGPLISAGAGLDYASIHQKGSGNKGRLNGCLGILATLSGRLSTDFTLYNPWIGGKRNRYFLSRESIAAVSFCWRVSEEFRLQSSVNHFAQSGTGGLFFLDYTPVEEVFLRLGISTGEQGPFFSGGYRLGCFAVAASCRFHTKLGMSPGLLIVYQSPAKTN